MTERMMEMEKQDRPLYGFHIGDSGLVRNEYHEYETYASADSYLFRSHTGRNVLKTKDQLDRYLNGYLYTFDPDPAHAVAAMKDTLEERISEAEVAVMKAQAEIRVLRDALECLGQTDTIQA